jgi:hypothetical protein
MKPLQTDRQYSVIFLGLAEVNKKIKKWHVNNVKLTGCISHHVCWMLILLLGLYTMWTRAVLPTPCRCCPHNQGQGHLIHPTHYDPTDGGRNATNTVHTHIIQNLKEKKREHQKHCELMYPYAK